MKFPYGISDFNKIVTKGYFYCDRTDNIPIIEEAGDSLLFLRPRRFGKSLLLSMLSNYYDVALKDRFKKIFGNLLISKKPTEKRNKYFILKLDFSCVNSLGNAQNIQKSLYDHINARIKGFKLYYKDFDIPDIEIDRDNAIYSIESMSEAMRKTSYPLYLIIDEYDNFANTVMMGIKSDQHVYEALVYEDGPLKTFFKAIKASASESLIDKTFITGVSPVVMSDITSGYNIAENIYLEPKFNDLCGFTEKEIKAVIDNMAEDCSLNEHEKAAALDIMQKYYNGYSFSYKADHYVYNPTLAIYFLKKFHEYCQYPQEMLDSNLSMDQAKLDYVAGISSGKKLIFDLINKNGIIETDSLENRFGINQMIGTENKDTAFMASFLYYFGVLTIKKMTLEHTIILKIPNYVTQKLYVEHIRIMLLPEPAQRDIAKAAAMVFYRKGDISPLCEFIENKYFKVFSNRDYIWANEMTVKTAFLTLLYNDFLYIMASEDETDRNYTDLTMIIRPDKREADIFDAVLEFKYVKLSDTGLTVNQAKALEQEELEAICQLKEKMADAKKRLKEYGDALEQKYKNLRLKRFAIVALGFERLWAKEIKN